MGNYSEFFKLREAKGIPAIYPQDVKQIQKVLKTKAGELKGIDNQGRIIFTTQGPAGEENRVITKTGSLTNPVTEEIVISKNPEEVKEYVNSFATDLTIPKEDVGAFIEQLKGMFPEAILQGELASNNGMWLFKDSAGNEFQVKAFYDKDGDLQAETYNIKGEKLEADKGSSQQKDQMTSNTLTNIDIQRIGGVIIKYVRSDISKMLLKEMPEAFRQVSVQIIGTGKKKESQIQRKKKLLEAGVIQQPTDLRVVVSFYPNKKGGEVILKADNWSTESAKKYIETAKNDLLVKYSKGIVFKDPTTNTPYQVVISDLNNLEITDENGYQGYFDLAATKVIKAENALIKAAKWLFSKSGNLDGSGNKGLASV